MSSTNDPLAWLDDALVELEHRDLRRHLTTRNAAQSAHVVIDGHKLVNFGSNDYLGLASDKRLAAAARAAAEREGWGGGASPLVSGRSESHAELERRLAEFEGTEAALVFPSGFAANAGIIPALVDEGDAVFADAKNHASLIDGCRLSRAKRFVYPHGDCEALDQLLQENHNFRRKLIVTDTLFSMDGDIAPLARIAELADEHHAMLMVDEAHTTGVFGTHGRGLVERLLHSAIPAAPGSAGGSTTAASVPTQTPGRAGGCQSGGDGSTSRIAHPTPLALIRVGTLSKALGSGGGFVCGTKSLIDWLANRARTYVFSTAQPPATSAAALAALEIVEGEPERRQQLLARAANLRQRLRDQGWNTGHSESQIIPLIIGDARRTMELAAAFRDAGFFIPGIRPPTVPENESLLRLSLCCHHTPDAINALIAQLARLR